MTRYFGKVCDKHPQCNGERTKVRRQCVGCKADYRKSRKDDYGREYLRQWKLQKRDINPVYNLMTRVRRRINHMLKGTSKSMASEQMLGCNWLDFRYHIESQFCDGMSWENMGEWQVDHIIPLASAKSIGEVIKLSHYTNLQPLWALDNARKGSKTAVDGFHRTK